MTSDLVLWNPSPGINIPNNINDPAKITGFARQLTEREQQQIVRAFESEAYEIASTFVWSKAMTGLKKQLGYLGMEFIGEMLDRSDFTEGSSATKDLTDYDAVRLAEQLGMFSSTQAMRLRRTLETMAFFSESAQEEDDDRAMAYEEAVMCLRACVQSILGQERLETAMEFARFRRDLEEKTFSASDREIKTLLAAPNFFQRTTLRVLLATAKTAQGAQLEHCLENTNVIVPELWPQLPKPDRWMVGRAYSEIYNEGKQQAVAGLRRALLKIKGFDYVPEDLRSRSFVEAAQKLIATHFELNNFYNEPRAIQTLASLGTTIPIPAFSTCSSAILCVKLGNFYGVSHNAQITANSLISNFGENRWKYYIDECLPGDEIILEKLMSGSIKILGNWRHLIRTQELQNIEFKSNLSVKLINASYQGSSRTVSDIARSMFERLTGSKPA